MIGAKQEWHDDDISMRSSESRHEKQDTILSIRTAAAEWEMHVKLRPVVMDHTPIGSNTFHQQHKIFMPMMDAVIYIAKNDGVKKQSLEGMRMEIRRKA